MNDRNFTLKLSNEQLRMIYNNDKKIRNIINHFQTKVVFGGEI